MSCCVRCRTPLRSDVDRAFHWCNVEPQRDPGPEIQGWRFRRQAEELPPARPHNRTGTRHSEATIDLIRARALGRRHSQETIEKIRSARIRQRFTPEIRERMAEARRRWWTARKRKRTAS